jgi:hypothetical protein
MRLPKLHSRDQILKSNGDWQIMGYCLIYSNTDEMARLLTQILLMLKMAGKIFERNKWSDYHRVF